MVDMTAITTGLCVQYDVRPLDKQTGFTIKIPFSLWGKD